MTCPMCSYGRPLEPLCAECEMQLREAIDGRVLEHWSSPQRLLSDDVFRTGALLAAELMGQKRREVILSLRNNWIEALEEQNSEDPIVGDLADLMDEIAKMYMEGRNE